VKSVFPTAKKKVPHMRTFMSLISYLVLRLRRTSAAAAYITTLREA
jgi:hypothetical protein